MNTESQFEHLNRHKYFVKSVQGIHDALQHWVKNVCSSIYLMEGVYIKGVNFDLKNEFLPAVIAFSRLPHYPGSSATNVVAFRFPDVIDVERHKSVVSIENAATKLPDSYYVGDNMYVVMTESGVLATAAHFAAYQNGSEFLPSEIAEELIFPRMMSFHAEDEDGYVSVNSVQLPANFNGTLDQLAQQIIETPV